MYATKKIKVTEVNPHLICVLCRGYYIDATTIIECLHSFCKTCIVKYLQTNKYCPICDVQIHKTSPLLNIRSDKTLQNVVYKLVPSLFKSEMERRVKFYKEHPGHLPALPEDRGEVADSSPIILPEEVLVICLEYLCDKPTTEPIPKRYLHCPAEMTLGHLTRLIRGKFNLLHSHQVNILFKNDLLPESLTIMEVAYTYQLRRKVPVHLFYRILELKRTTIRLLEVKERKDEVSSKMSDSGVTDPSLEERASRAEKRPSSSLVEGSALLEKSIVVEKPPSADRNCDLMDSEWKEVQLQISENGVMSVRNMKSSECSPKPAVEAPAATSQINTPAVAQLGASMTTAPTTTAQTVPSTTPALQISRPASSSNGPIVSLPSELTTTIVPSNYSANARFASTKPILSVSKVTKDQVKKDFNNIEANKLSISRVPAAGFKEKSEVLNKIVSKLSPNERVIGNTSVTIRPVLSTPPNIKTYHPPVSQAQLMPQQHQQHPLMVSQSQPPSKMLKVERKPQQTLRYKTLTSPTKQWNPSIDRTTMLSMKQNYDETKPPRFFKMRNLPRYLGNPASGVKPMFGSPQQAEDGSKDQKARSPSKLPPPFTPGSPKAGKSPYPEKTSWAPRVPSPAHSASIYNSNPYLLYSGFPGSFNPDPAMLVNANPELVRSMFANAAYHTSLPPSMNMLFNPLHNMPRPTMESNPAVQQRIPRTKSPSTKSDEKGLEKPIPNLIPATLSSPHALPRSPTLPSSTMGIPTAPSIPPHPSHPPGSLLPPGASSLPPRLHPPMSVPSPLHVHNSLLHPSSPLHPSHHNLSSTRVHTSPVGSPRTSSPLHGSPPKSAPLPVYISSSKSPKNNQKPEQQKSLPKGDRNMDTCSEPSVPVLPPAPIVTSAPPQTTSSPTSTPAASSIIPKPPPSTVMTSSSCQTVATPALTVSSSNLTPTPSAPTPISKAETPQSTEPKTTQEIAQVVDSSVPADKLTSSTDQVAVTNKCTQPSVPDEKLPSIQPSLSNEDTGQKSIESSETTSDSTATPTTAPISKPESPSNIQEKPSTPAIEPVPAAQPNSATSLSPSKSDETVKKVKTPEPSEKEAETKVDEKPDNEIRSDNNNISKENEIPGKTTEGTADSKEN